MEPIIRNHEDLVWIKWRLSELSNQEPDDIESNEIEILGEDEHGNEGFCTQNITDIASDAYDMIASLENQLMREHDYDYILKRWNDSFDKLAEMKAAAKTLFDLKSHKELHGKDEHYMNSKNNAWFNLEMALHNNGMCESSCGICYTEATTNE